MLTSIYAIIIVLGVLITFHELGHFTFAKLFGVGVEKFSIGFGPKIFSIKKNFTEYCVAVIPLGGFVKMVGEQPGAELKPEEIPLSFSHKNLFQRSVIVAAGPVFNFILAALIFFLLLQIDGTVKSKIGEVQENTVAYKAGLRQGDTIYTVNDKNTLAWKNLDNALAESNGKEVTLFVERENSKFNIKITPELITGKNPFGEDISQYGIGIIPNYQPVIGKVHKDKPAQKAGFQSGDKIIAINGIHVATSRKIAEIIGNSKGNNLQFSINRDNNILNMNFAPELLETNDKYGNKIKRYMIGIEFLYITEMVKLNPIDAFIEGIKETYLVTKLTILGVAKIFMGKVSFKKNIGGPIFIAQLAGKKAKMGFDNLLNLIAILSVNLAILNLLPIPVLDGGHLLFFGIEAIIRKPVNLKIREVTQAIGFIILISLMLFVFYNDLVRVFS